MRCFTPVYGIRAYDTDEILFEIAFCFHCHSALILTAGHQQQSTLTGFDPGSDSARELLATFQATDHPLTAPGGDRV